MGTDVAEKISVKVKDITQNTTDFAITTIYIWMQRHADNGLGFSNSETTITVITTQFRRKDILHMCI